MADIFFTCIMLLLILFFWYNIHATLCVKLKFSPQYVMRHSFSSIQPTLSGLDAEKQLKKIFIFCHFFQNPRWPIYCPLWPRGPVWRKSISASFYFVQLSVTNQLSDPCQAATDQLSSCLVLT